MDLAEPDHDVAVVDMFPRRLWDHELGADSLIPILPLQDRVALWTSLGKRPIKAYVGDIAEWEPVERVFTEFRPDSIIHYAEHRAAPFSMLSRRHAVLTQVNNVVAALNV